MPSLGDYMTDRRIEVDKGIVQVPGYIPPASRTRLLGFDVPLKITTVQLFLALDNIVQGDLELLIRILTSSCNMLLLTLVSAHRRAVAGSTSSSSSRCSGVHTARECQEWSTRLDHLKSVI